jgi:short-subunit dehydrogenase
VKAYNVKVTAVYPFFSRTPILQSERYGRLAEEIQEIPDHLLTDPANVMRETIQGIVHDQLHVFPDAIAKNVHILKRYSPWLLGWISNKFTRRLKRGADKSLR